AALQRGLARAVEAHSRLVDAIAAERDRWDEAELVASPRSPLRPLRAAALAARRLASAVARGDARADVAAARTAFVDALAAARAAVDAGETAAVDGGDAFVRALAPMETLAGKTDFDADDRREAVVWVNQALAVFNRLVVTR
ncbi:MAG: hypothetical protein D6689_09890, partial [Deltaproteobacteria bacterium]